MNIKTNHHWRPVLYWYELTEKEQAEFDYLDSPENARFIRYQGVAYDVGDIMRLESTPPWHGYAADSYFTATLFRFSSDCEYVQCARCYS